MTQMQPAPKAEKKPVFDRLDKVKRKGNSVLMRPTLNSRGGFVKRSVCGSPAHLEATLERKDSFRQDFELLKRLLQKS